MVQRNVKKSLIKIKMMMDYETIAIKFEHPSAEGNPLKRIQMQKL